MDFAEVYNKKVFNEYAKVKTIRKTYTAKKHPFINNKYPKRLKVPYIAINPNDKTKIILLGSPEAYAVTTGFIEKNKIVPARLHIGPKRSLDNAVATYQSLQIPGIKKILSSETEESLLVVDILREGIKTQAQDNLYMLYKKVFTTVILSMSHKKDNKNPLKRSVYLGQAKFEGVNKKRVKTVVISDSIAGGVTMFYALEFLKKELPNLKKVIIISPHLAITGAFILAEYFKKANILGILVGFGALLKSNPPEMYYSPLPVDKPKYFADTRHINLAKYLYKDLAGKICVAGNWTAMFLAPQAAYKEIQEELKTKNWKNKIKKRKITNKILKTMGFKPSNLKPASQYV